MSLVSPSEERQRFVSDAQPQGLPADGIEVRERLQLVVADVLTATGGKYLSADLVLDVRMLGKKLQNLCHQMRGSVRRGKKQKAESRVSDLQARTRYTYDIWPTICSSGSLSAAAAAMFAFTVPIQSKLARSGLERH